MTFQNTFCEDIRNLINIKVNGYISIFFHQFSKGNNICDFMFASLEEKNPLKMGSTLKGKNLLLREQILSFKS